jgi:mannan endo-1,4-beta-mannosidase
VTWLWTVNVIDADGGIRDPAPWWPGDSYVNWIGLDGYYRQSWTFAPLFGPTIKAVRALARDPVLIAETGVPPAADKPAKITNLFDGVRAYGLVGFVWFNAIGIEDWRLEGQAATSAFRRGAAKYRSHP